MDEEFCTGSADATDKTQIKKSETRAIEAKAVE
jgi:hypothetical protein